MDASKMVEAMQNSRPYSVFHVGMEVHVRVVPVAAEGQSPFEVESHKGQFRRAEFAKVVEFVERMSREFPGQFSQSR